MVEKLFGMKEAAKLLGCSVRTLQRRHQAGDIRCVFTPGGRRRIPESELLRLREKMGFKEKPEIAEKPIMKIIKIGVPQAEMSSKEDGIFHKKPEKELFLQKAIDLLEPASLVERLNFRDMLAISAKLGVFSPDVLAQMSKCSHSFAVTFCERLISKGLGAKEGERVRLLVRII